MIAVFQRLQLYFNTLRYLKPRQIFFQIYYRIKFIIAGNSLSYNGDVPARTILLILIPSIPSPSSYHAGAFTFLNKNKSFTKSIDWNFKDFGKLWTYNLNYFDFLHHEGMESPEGCKLIDSYLNDFNHIREGIKPYPISLRGINWIKFFSYYKINNNRFNAILFSHYKQLLSHLEYHLLGNHLLENGFSLLFGSYYFKDESLYYKAKGLLETELKEQILSDGAHFELSPMYHQILLFRLLDCINLVKFNPWKNDELLGVLIEKANAMLGWLKEITFENGDIPLVNDSAFGIAPSPDEIFRYAKRLKLKIQESKLGESGYRMIRIGELELFIDVGNIGPDYIPGHAHCDTFNFVLYVGGQPIIVDPGVSTYEKGQQRQIERSTRSHNTVEINGKEQSEVWSVFRVGRRAKISDLSEVENRIIASHDGYKRIGYIHQRKWQWKKEELIIEDEITGKATHVESIACLHFHPDCCPAINGKTIIAGPLQIQCTSHNKIEIDEFDFSEGFNKLRKGRVVYIHFQKRLGTIFDIRQI